MMCKVRLVLVLSLLQYSTCAFRPQITRRTGLATSRLSYRTSIIERTHVKVKTHKHNDVDATTKDDLETTKMASNRREMLSFTLATLLALETNVVMPNTAANAYVKAFPDELKASDEVVDGRNRRINQVTQKELQREADKKARPFTKPVATLVWGSALWFLAGSRSNPLLTPLANLFYDDNNEKWLKDRNDGLFADVPWPLYVVMGVVFLAAGYGTDSAILELVGNDTATSLQLAGVSLITGGALELGRIASGEKKETREESDRNDGLEQDFLLFAEKRLKKGGNCHRSEVIKAFRRFHAKYRQADNPDYPLSDLEIERLLRTWGRTKGIEMSSAGFFSNIQIDADADVFVKR